METQLPVISVPCQLEEIAVPEVKPLKRSLIITSFVCLCVAPILAGLVAVAFMMISVATTTPVIHPVPVKNSITSPAGSYKIKASVNGEERGEVEETINSLGEKAPASADVETVVDSKSVATPSMQDVSKQIYGAVSGFVGFIFCLLLVITMMLFYMVVCTIVVYRGWLTLQPTRWLYPGETLDNPTVESSGLLLLPYFQLFWMFPCLLRLEKFGRKMSASLGVGYSGPEHGMIMVALIFQLAYTVLSFIPYIGALALLLTIPIVILSFIIVLKINRMVEDLGKPYTVKTLLPY